MNDILNYYINSLSKSTLTLKKKGILVEKPWALIDDDGDMQKLIFKGNGDLILSKNGIVTEGRWEYFPQAKSILIDRVSDKLLLKEMFIDSNVIILKRDGTDNQIFAMGNENTLPDLNIPKYLNDLDRERLRIREVKLHNGKTLQALGYTEKFNGLKVRNLDRSFDVTEIQDGRYLSETLNSTFVIINSRIRKLISNQKIKLAENETLIIEADSEDLIINAPVTINGRQIQDQRINTAKRVYDIAESRVMKMFYLESHELAKGWTVAIEHQRQNNFSKGDKIVESKPVTPIPDGKYRRKGHIEKINIKNMEII